jgi:hypothetical protein
VFFSSFRVSRIWYAFPSALYVISTTGAGPLPPFLLSPPLGGWTVSELKISTKKEAALSLATKSLSLKMKAYLLGMTF